VILIQDKLTIVLAGAFNPAILTPQWIAINALNYPNEQLVQVELLAPIGGGVGTHRLTFDHMSYTAGYKGTTFYLMNQSAEVRESVCVAIGTIMSLLPHTPMSGVGFNFSFRVEHPPAELLNLLQVHEGLNGALGDDTTVVNRSWANTLSYQESLLNFSCQLAGAEVIVDCNYHHNVSSAMEAAAIMNTPGVYAQHLNVVIGAVSALTNQQLEA
jgi:hypothetical protein